MAKPLWKFCDEGAEAVVDWVGQTDKEITCPFERSECLWWVMRQFFGWCLSVPVMGVCAVVSLWCARFDLEEIEPLDRIVFDRFLAIRLAPWLFFSCRFCLSIHNVNTS